MGTSKNIINCDSQGFPNKKHELLEFLSIFKPGILCIQETILRKQSNFNIKHYKGLFSEGHVNYRARGGIGILILEANPHEKIALEKPL